MPSPTLSIAFATDAGYALPTATAAMSIADHAEAGRSLRVFVLHMGIETDTLGQLHSALSKAAERAAERGADMSFEVLKVDPEKLLGFRTGRLSLSAYLRLLVPDALPADIDRLVYLDCDTLVLRDLGPLLEVDLAGAAAAAAVDLSTPTVGRIIERHEEVGLPTDHPYMNSGVMVMDLSVWREHRLGDAVMDDLLAHQHLYKTHDQCGINVALAGRLIPLSAEWNVQAASVRSVPLRADAGVLHFTHRKKPWNPDFTSPGRFPTLLAWQNAWWKAARRTGWHSAKEWAVLRSTFALANVKAAALWATKRLKARI